MSIFKIFKHENRVSFYQLVINQMDTTLKGIQTLKKYCDTGDEAVGEEVLKIEKEGDLQRRILIDDINNTFVTPLDREDLFELSRAIDDILDYAKSTVEELKIYKIKPNDDIKAMVNVLVDISISLDTAVHQLENHKKISVEEAVKAKKFENAMEEIYRTSLAKLFENEDIKYILKNRELYRHLSNAADKGDLAANILCDIVVKFS